MDSLGAYLRQEREKKNISLDEAIEATRISRNILIALEEERPDQLPPLPFLKGFIRSYSLFLGLDPVETTSHYLQSLPEKQENSYGDKSVSVDFYVNKPLVLLLKKNKHRAFIFTYILLTLSLLIVSFLWFQAQEFNKGKLFNATLLDTASIDKKEKNIPRTYQEASIGKSVNNAHLAEKIERSEIIDQELNSEPEEENEVMSGELISEDSVEEKKLLVIQAKDTTWIDIKIDSEEHYDFIMPPGSMKELEANNRFDLLLGNAAGVEINFQGKSLGVLGNPNQVVRVRLPFE